MNTLVLRRRLTYICAMVVLLVPLYFLGNPSVRKPDGSVIREGGVLAQLRTAYDLGQSDLGELDPASETMRLATLGQRGAAIAILWQRAEYYKREKVWDSFQATLNQIAILQPHFVKVWEFQSHNLAYNVSVEFDDYRQRYAWVKRGMNYLVEGGKFNKTRTELPFELGRVFGNKLGVADEKVQFRELFRADGPFHEEMAESSGIDVTQRAGLGPDGRPDNWRVGTLWSQHAYDMVAAGSPPAKSHQMFYLQGTSWDMKHAEAIQSEGYLDEAARLAWERAQKSYFEYGQRQIPAQTMKGVVVLFLNELEIAVKDYEEKETEFQKFCGETYDKMVADRMSQLTDEEIAARDKDESERTFEELLLARRADELLEIQPIEIAKATPKDIQVEALRLANRLYEAEERTRLIDSYRNRINYAYWEARCVAEQEPEALMARTNMYEANQLLDAGELDKALEKYEVAWSNWASLFNDHPGMMVDDLAEDILDSIERYRRLLDEPDLPDDFELKNFMEFRRLYTDNLADPNLMSVISSWPKRFPGRNFLEEMLKVGPVEREPEPGNPYDQSPKPVEPSGRGLEIDLVAPAPPLPDVDAPQPQAETTLPTEPEAPPKPEPAEPAVEPAEPAVEPEQPANEPQEVSEPAPELRAQRPDQGSPPAPPAPTDPN
ncbi:MAG: hypothetical protein R3C53_07815 [Pirellulaceae bacterium]